jgi:hypothetical protein
MNNVIIIDDVVDKVTQNLIESTIFGKDTQWIFSRTTFYDKHPEVTEQQRTSLMAFTKPILDPEKRYRDKNIDLYHNLVPNVKTMLHSRIQLQLPVITEIDKIYGVPHVDGYRPFPYQVAVYYVNDSDGDTVLFKQTTHNASPEDVKNGLLEIDTTVSPKKGRLVIFPGDVYHAVGKPKNDIRCIINYNFV